jgi:hypothetical protein
MDRDSGNNRGHGVRDSARAEVERPFLGRREIALAWVVHPQTMGIEVGGNGDLGNVKAFRATQRGNDLRRQKVGVDNEVPRLCFENADERAKV